MKFSNIRLLVNDFDTCFSFYSDTLGLECSWGKPGDVYASFNIGAPSGLALFKAELMSAAMSPAGQTNVGDVQDKVALVLQVDNLDETYSSLKSRGVDFLAEPKDMSAWGIRVAHFRDPENNLIELFSELSKDKWDEQLVEDDKEF